MKQLTFAGMYSVAFLSVVNSILVADPSGLTSGQIGWASSAIGWGLAAYLIYRSEFEIKS